MTQKRVRLGVRDGVELLLVRDRRVWRRWRWVMCDHTRGMQTVEGRAWTRRQAEAHAHLARALRWLGNEERAIVERATREAL